MVSVLDNIGHVHQTSEKLTWEMMTPRMLVRQRRLGSAWSCKYYCECDRLWWPQVLLSHGHSDSSDSVLITRCLETDWALAAQSPGASSETRRRNFESWTLGTLGMTRGFSGLSSIQSFQKWTASIKFQFTWIVWTCTPCSSSCTMNTSVCPRQLVSGSQESVWIMAVSICKRKKNYPAQIPAKYLQNI